MDETIIQVSGNKIKVKEIPFSNGSKKMNTYFLKICELIEPYTNRLCCGKRDNGLNKPITEELLYMYIGVKKTSIRKIMHLFRKAHVIADFITSEGHTFIVNPKFAMHMDGVYNSIYVLFDMGDIQTTRDKLEKHKKALVREINEELEKRRKDGV
jgi:hypothetical protein